MSTSMAPEMEALKTRLKATWEAGDYGVFAKYLEPGALEFFSRLGISPGTKLLDVGCGAGQLTIPAAKQGIDVTGLDLAQNLVDQANARARAEGLDIEIRQGDAESLPFPDASFDVTMSLIGSMFAPRPELVAAEMVRVTRPGGNIIMGNWTPAGHIGQMFKVIGKHVPPPPIFPSPLLWGDEAKVRERLGTGVSELNITTRLYPFAYPFPPAEVVDFFIEYYGPTKKAHGSLDEAGAKALRDDLIELWTRNNIATDGATRVEAEYIEVIGTKA
ncbi:MAG: class I SAM-dependent methyltransferase [Fimbriimonadaceae bacterium]